MFGDAMLCLPLYSFALEGIMAVPQRLQNEYIALVNERDQADYSIEGQNITRISVGCYGAKQMHPKALVHLSGAVEVRYHDFVCVG